MYMIDELWIKVKNYLFDYKKLHMKKYKPIVKCFDNMFKEIYKRWTRFPVWQNTNEISREEENYEYLDKNNLRNLPLTSVCFNPNRDNNGGWYCGYGWRENIKK
jgi:hypothetical protein